MTRHNPVEHPYYFHYFRHYITKFYTLMSVGKKTNKPGPCATCNMHIHNFTNHNVWLNCIKSRTKINESYSYMLILVLQDIHRFLVTMLVLHFPLYT